MQITQNCCDISKGWNKPHVVACLVLLGSTELLPPPFAAFSSLLSPGQIEKVLFCLPAKLLRQAKVLLVEVL